MIEWQVVGAFIVAVGFIPLFGYWLALSRDESDRNHRDHR